MKRGAYVWAPMGNLKGSRWNQGFILDCLSYGQFELQRPP